MVVVGVELVAESVRIVIVEGDPVGTFAVPFNDEWTLAEPDRADDYVSIRKRLVDLLVTRKPDAVCVEPLEPAALRRPIRWATVQAAELRGVVIEAARAAGARVVVVYKKTVNENIGARDADAYVKDDTEWNHLGHEFLKKFRRASVVALAWLRSQ